MSKAAVSWEGRRALTDNPHRSGQALVKAAAELKEAGQLAEAITFFKLAEDQRGLAEIRTLAVEEGNFFLWQAAQLGKNFERTELEALAEAAKKNGRLLYEEKARQRLSELS